MFMPDFPKEEDSEDDDDDLDFNDPKIQKNPGTQILWLAEHGWTEKAQEILDGDKSLVDSYDSDKYTPLHRASYNGHTDMMKLLLSYGANVLARTIDGWQPLHCAARWNQSDAATVLLENGAKVNETTNGGQTALHLAASNRDSRNVLSILLADSDVDISIKNKVGDTARDVCRRTSDAFDLFDKSSRR